MEREITQWIDKETGDINKLRDDKLDSAATDSVGTSVAQGSAIMIKAANGGGYVEVDRDSFMSVVKSCVADIINNSSLKQEAPKTLVLDSNGDLGAVQPSTLASVLSGTVVPGESYLIASRNDGANPGNLNQYTFPGIFTFEGMSNAQNEPSDLEKSHAHLLIVAKSASSVAHVLIDTEGTGGHIFVRYQINVSWKTLK